MYLIRLRDQMLAREATEAHIKMDNFCDNILHKNKKKILVQANMLG